jgi:glutamyl-tRNA synthetase
MSVRVRIAPSPTGMLHVGNVRTALMNWLFAKAHGGEFMLRIDDTDLERSRAEFETAQREDLTWLGLTWDLTDWQSKRFDRYDAARDALIAKGLLYPCYETEDELERKRRIAQATGRPPIYDRAALALSDADRAKLEAEGRKPHWRFKLSGGRAEWKDLIRGPQSIDTTSVSDPVLIRGDGLYLYTLPSVVDDAEFKISHVIRGEDHVTNTGVQIEIFRALDAPLPDFAHSPLTIAASGEALSKRDLEGPLSIHNLRKDGIEPIAILSLLAKIGTSDPVEARTDIMDLARDFSFDKVGRAPARVDLEDRKRVNAQVLHMTPYDAVKARLVEIDADGGEAFWLAVRANLASFAEAADWARIIAGPIAPKIADAAFAAAAADLVPEGALDGASWSAFVDAVKAKTGAKGKALFMPLRQALTGLDHGPEMAPIFALIGRDKAIARLRGQAA